MRERIDAVTLHGATLRVSARAPLPAELPVLALATAIRVFERYPVLERLTVTLGEAKDDELSLTRAEVARWLGPQGFASLRAWGGWPHALARAVHAYTGERAE